MSEFLVSVVPQARQSPLVSIESNGAISLQDSTTGSRIGFRGPAVEAWLIEEQLPIPAQANRAVMSDSGLCVVRLSQTEFWILDDSQKNHQQLLTLETRGLSQQGVNRLYCQHSHAAFMCQGRDCASMFAKVCGVDLSHTAFSKGGVAQTSVARVNAMIINASDSADVSDRYWVLSDVSSSQHLWDALLDAAQEF